MESVWYGIVWFIYFCVNFYNFAKYCIFLFIDWLIDNCFFAGNVQVSECEHELQELQESLYTSQQDRAALQDEVGVVKITWYSYVVEGVIILLLNVYCFENYTP